MNNDDESPFIVTKYSKNAASLINSFSSFFTIIIYVTVLLTIFSIMDIIGLLHVIGLSNEYLHDVIIMIILITLLSILAISFMYILKIKKTLNRWHDMFESASLKANISLLTKDKKKEEILYAIAESVSEINNLIQRYTRTNTINRFFDVKVGDAVFDIVIDKDNVDADAKKILQDYGSIIARITKEADKETINKFIEQLVRYHKITNNKVGIGIIIAEKIEHIETNKVKGIDRIVLVEKPTISF
ncbi:MAG: hypothetical protein QW416_06125 [Candidatus Nitrosocaldaceae archaeon]